MVVQLDTFGTDLSDTSSTAKFLYGQAEVAGRKQNMHSSLIPSANAYSQTSHPAQPQLPATSTL